MKKFTAVDVTREEVTGLLLEALAQGFVKPDAVVRWADQAIAVAPEPPEWLVDLSTLPKFHTEDVAALLRRQAAALPVRRKRELIALAWHSGLLSLRDAIPKLFRITILDHKGEARENLEAALHEALVSWDSQEDLDVLSPELETSFERALRQFLPVSADVEWCLSCLGERKAEPGVPPNGGPADYFDKSGVDGGPPSLN